MKHRKFRLHGGVTLVELIAILAIMGILAAVAVPSMIGFVEKGKQMNRMNIARTIYLAAQNQMTEMKITKNLIANLTGEYYTLTAEGQYAEDTDKLANHNNVYEKLGDENFPDEEIDNGNENYVHYISKPRGQADPTNPLVKLLEPIILDKEILDGAILIEYNVRTGVVLSAFYGDMLDEGVGFTYDDDGENDSIYGHRGMGTDGQDGYEFYDERKQGYYGVRSTNVTEDTSEVMISIKDSYIDPLPDDTTNGNVLYAEILILQSQLANCGPFDLLVDDTVVETSIDLKAVTDMPLATALLNYTGSGSDTSLIYRYDGDINRIEGSGESVPDNQKYARFIWVLDYVGGDMTTNEGKKHSIYEKYGSVLDFDTKSNLLSNIHVAIEGDASAYSFTEAHPYYLTDIESAYGNATGMTFKVNSARHLYNIRHIPDADFTQGANIELNTGSSAGSVINFEPIPDFKGTFTGTGYVIKNLAVDVDGSAGLFESITGTKSGASYSRASVVGLTLENPSVEGTDNVGSVCGTSDAYMTGIYVRFNDEAATESGIRGNSNVGGIVGENKGMLTDSTFISPLDEIHVAGSLPSKDSIGGIAGSNSADGAIKRVLFLALAPKNGTNINPIVGDKGTTPDASFEELYYLCGIPIRPSRGSGEYNLEKDNGVGTGIGTNGLTYITMGNNWEIPTLTEEQVLDLSNQIYAYQHPKYSRTQVATFPDWPIVEGGGVITISDIAYYEEYSDGTYGTWFVGDTGSGSLISDDRDSIVEAGYAVVLNNDLTGTHYFFARAAEEIDDWDDNDNITQIDLENDTDFAVGLSTAANEPNSWVFKLPLDELSDLEKQSRPLQIMYTISSDGKDPQDIYGFLQPLFAKGIYPSGSASPTPTALYVRTPWQMKNIEVLTAGEDTGTNYSQDITFTQELSLDFSNTGIGVNSKDGLGDTDLVGSAVGGLFKGTYDGGGNYISDVKITSTGAVGLFSQNLGAIKNLTLTNSEIKSENSDAGGIACSNGAGGTITDCLVENTNILLGSSSTAGGITANNEGDVKRAGVAYSTVGKEIDSGNVGGIVGRNGRSVRDVFFISTDDVDDIPVSKSGGGIAGYNDGTVENAIYLAPAPTSTGITATTTAIYPIVRGGNPALTTGSGENENETCFYLAGNRYSLNEGQSWIPDNYSLVSSIANVELSGGGTGLVTKFIDVEWLGFAYGTDMSDWMQPTKGYPYPVIDSMDALINWPEADSPVRPDQVDRDTENDPWGILTPTSERGISPNFVNGDFSVGDFTDKVLQGQNPSHIATTTHGTQRIYIDMAHVDGWYTRPVSVNLTPTGNWRLIELQEPINISGHSMINQYAKANYKGEYKTNSTNAYTSPYRYAELNADEQGTLYQVLPTTPNKEFYYSFYHTSRTSGQNATASDRMNFYLTPFNGGTLEVTTNAQRDARDAAMVLIRPCQSPRDGGNGVVNASNGKNASAWNADAWDTVAYGASDATTNGYDLSYHNGRSYLQPDGETKVQNIPTGRVYLYDVWVGNNSSPRSGYGITFWSTVGAGTGNGANNIPTDGVTNLTTSKSGNQRYLPSSLLNDANNHVIGYWDVSYGWKHYYGMYEVGQNQEMTEFAFQSRTADAKSGNYLDGISFKSSSFMSVDKSIKLEDEDAKFVKPEQTLTVSLDVKNWGDLPADNIVIEDQLYPFNQYIEFVPGTVVVKDASGTAIGNLSVTPPDQANEHTVKIALPESYKLGKEKSLKVTFDIKVRDKVLVDRITPTLLYYFKNQAEVKYKEDSENSEHFLTAYQSVIRGNASGPEPVQVFIDPINMTKTVLPEIDGPFTVKLTIENTLTTGGSIETKGLVTDVIPKGFEVVEGTLPTGATVTPNPDGSKRIAIKDVNLDDADKKKDYEYKLRYEGEGYGVAYTSITANYKYLYSSEAESLNVMLVFPQDVVGIKVKAKSDNFDWNGTGTAILNILSNDNLKQENKLADDNYDVTPVVMLTDENGAAKPKNTDGHYWVDDAEFRAVLRSGDNLIEFTPKTTASGIHEFYYKVNLIAQKGDHSLDLSSEVTKVTVVVGGGGLTGAAIMETDGLKRIIYASDDSEGTGISANIFDSLLKGWTSGLDGAFGGDSDDSDGDGVNTTDTDVEGENATDGSAIESELEDDMKEDGDKMPLPPESAALAVPPLCLLGINGFKRVRNKDVKKDAKK